MSAGRTDLARNPGGVRGTGHRGRVRRGSGRVRPGAGRTAAVHTGTAAAGGVRLAAELDTAAVSAVCCCFRNRGRVSERFVSATDTAAACGCRLL
jgi:hypothetical protein